jgi:ATP-dependent helicase HrpA
VRRQFAHLFVTDFLTTVPWQWLQHYPRYLQAVLVRFDRLQGGGLDRDRQHTAELTILYDAFEERHTEVTRQGGVDAELDYYGWMLQEYRVSLFAQQLGTSETVSAKRLEKQWKKIH